MTADATPSRLVLALHNHQPVGNFDGVFAENLRRSYRPFLETLRDYPDLRVVLHTSGSLLEWLLANAADYVGEVRELAAAGQVEILGGLQFEAVMAGIPRRDRVGQILAFADQLEDVFGVRPRGMWVPERVWEPSFTGDVTAAGVEYTLLDDCQFHAAGHTAETTPDSVLCEDEGRLLRVFPISERLRYLIPFGTVEDVVADLRTRHAERPGRTWVFGDDGEKFGGWPETFEHCYEKGWLRDFFDRLTAETDWLRTATLADVADSRPADGRMTLSDGSYAEMTEWVLPSGPQRTLQQLRGRGTADAAAPEAVRPFLRGGTWRNFFAKYPEAAEMAARMKELSARLEALRRSGADARLLAEATTRLYRGQCNCPYWHGSFGGLYLPHLRQAIYAELLAVESLIRPLERGDAGVLTLLSHDLNLDGRPEVRLGGDRLLATVEPHTGGHLASLEVPGVGVNLGATLSRRTEPYHLDLRRGGDARAKQVGLAEHLQTDAYRRRCLVDHVFEGEPDFDAFLMGGGVDAAAAESPYAAVCRREADGVEVELTGRRGAVEVRKTVRVEAARPGDLAVRYELSGLPEHPVWFGVEFNLAGMAPGAEDRYFYSAAGDKLGPLDRQLDLTAVGRFGLCDEWLGLDVAFDFSRDCELWAAPVRTVSGSEGGVELVYQQTCLLPRWRVTADADGRWSCDVVLSCDTTAAAARSLATAAALA